MSTVSITTNNKKTLIPKNFKSTLPPRKRAKTKEEKEQRRIERIMRNRRAARKSRERKRLYMESMEEKLKIYDEIFQVLNVNEQLSSSHPELLTKLTSFHDKSKDLLTSDDEEIEHFDEEEEGSVNNSPNSTTSNSTSTTLVKEESEEQQQQQPISISLKKEVENDNIEEYLSKIKQEEQDHMDDFSFNQFQNIYTYNTPTSLTETSSNLQMQWFDSMTPSSSLSQHENEHDHDQVEQLPIIQTSDSLNELLSSPIDWEIMRNPAVYFDCLYFIIRF